MTRAEEKLIVFTDLLNLAIRQIKIYLNHPNPEMRGLIYHFPRIISNSIYDNTSGIEYCIQKVPHTNGNFFRREFNQKLISDLKISIKEAKKDLRQKSFKKHKGKYKDEIPNIHQFLVMANNQIFGAQKELSLTEPVGFMIEHVIGREMASKYILDATLQSGVVLDTEKTKELLKRFCFTIQLEKVGNLHTQANSKLEEIQRGDATFDNYEKIITELGYQDLLEELRPRFEEAKIDLKYFK